MFDTPLRLQFDKQWYSRTIRPVVVAKLAERQVPLRQYAQAFDPMTGTLARSLVICMVPVLALAAALVNNRQRRPVVHHVSFALYSFGAVLILQVGILAAFVDVAAAKLLLTGYGFAITDAMYSLVALAGVTLFLAASQRGAYGDGWRVAAGKGFLLAVSLGIALQFYRLLLFWVTFRAT
jgi:uncharacterized membrane protein YuzA (DUF378 family)